MALHETREGGRVARVLWSRHANPRSVWSLVVAYPLLVLAIYLRRRSLLVGTLLFVLVNPLLFSPPDDDDAWATRVVLGEQVWLDRGSPASVDTLFVAVSAPVYLYTLSAAAGRRPAGTALGTVASMVLMFLFFERMTRLYERHEPNGR